MRERALLLLGWALQGPRNRVTPCLESPPFHQNPVLLSVPAAAPFLWTSPPLKVTLTLFPHCQVPPAADLCVGPALIKTQAF